MAFFAFSTALGGRSASEVPSMKDAIASVAPGPKLFEFLVLISGMCRVRYSPEPSPAVVNVCDVAQPLEFDGVAAAVAHRHQHLLAHRAFLVDSGLVDEIGAVLGELAGDLFEIFERRDDTEVAQRRLVTGELAAIVSDHVFGSQMRDDVMAEEIEIGAPGELASLGTAEHFTVKLPGAIEIANGKRKMKQRTHGHFGLLRSGPGGARPALIVNCGFKSPVGLLGGRINE